MSKVVPISVDKLDQLAARINREQAAAYGNARKAVEHAAECGRLLLNAKELVEHGEWLPWLEANTEVSPRQSQNYMKLAENWPEIESKYEASSHFTLTGALKLLAQPKRIAPTTMVETDCDTGRTRKLTKKEVAQFWEDNAADWKAHWLRCHPERTPEEYDEVREAQQDDTSSPYWGWRRAMGEGWHQAKRAAWLRDHPGQTLPEHECQMSDEQYAEYQEWQDTYEPPEITATMDDDDDDAEDLEVINPESVLPAYLFRAEAAREMCTSCATLIRRFSESSTRLTKKRREDLATAVMITAETADAWGQLAQLMKDEYGGE